MIKISKLTSFILMITSVIFGAITFSRINWNNIIDTETFLNELGSFLSLMLSTIFFVIYYIKKLKEFDKNNVA